MEIVGTISENSRFKILKARSGTKYVILKTSKEQDSMSLEFLRREYEIGVTLSHPCIVSTLGFDEKIPAIVLEYIEGKTLDEFIPDRRSDVLKDILDGVDYLHHRGVLHNDLKPSNIIVTPNGHARIIDFGLSYTDDSIYKGCIGGSRGFSAPEILDGRGPAKAASDIYSVGNIIKKLYPSHYKRIVSKCISQDPNARYQSISQLRNAILRSRLLVPAIVAAILIIASLFPILKEPVKEIETYSLKCEYHERLAPQFNSAVRHMEKQQYKELANMVYEKEYFYPYLRPLMDSLVKPGEPTDEMIAICSVNEERLHIVDSIIESKPSIRTLPKKRQKALRDSLLNSISERLSK